MLPSGPQRMLMGRKFLSAETRKSGACVPTYVEQVGNNAAGQEAIAIAVKVHAPGVARSFGEDAEFPRGDIVVPDRGVELHAIDLGMGEDAVQAVQFAVRSPLKRVERFMRVV